MAALCLYDRARAYGPRNQRMIVPWESARLRGRLRAWAPREVRDRVGKRPIKGYAASLPPMGRSDSVSAAANASAAAGRARK
jgi:hypothetical protein